MPSARKFNSPRARTREEMKTQREKAARGFLFSFLSFLLFFAQTSWPALRKRDASCYNATPGRSCCFCCRFLRAACRPGDGSARIHQLRHPSRSTAKPRAPLFVCLRIVSFAQRKEAELCLQRLRGFAAGSTDTKEASSCFIAHPEIHVSLL